MSIPMLFPRSARLLRDCRGTAILETALVLPVIMSLLLGVAEFGRALQQQHVLTKSVRDAGRYLARAPLACPRPGQASADPADVADWSRALGEARNLAATGSISGGTALVTGWTAASFQIAEPVCANAVHLITVSADMPFADLGFLRALGLGAVRLGAAHQQIHVGE